MKPCDGEALVELADISFKKPFLVRIPASSSAALLGLDGIPAWRETPADDISDGLNRRPRWPTETERQ